MGPILQAPHMMPTAHNVLQGFHTSYVAAWIVESSRRKVPRLSVQSPGL
jgi:hypothetical protein